VEILPEYQKALSIFFHWPGVQGCMTKMVAGYRCGENVTMSKSEVETSEQRLRSYFAFVGLTEVNDTFVPPSIFRMFSIFLHQKTNYSIPLRGFVFLLLPPSRALQKWDVSVCLFHQILGGQARDIEFMNYRAGKVNRDEVYE